MPFKLFSKIFSVKNVTQKKLEYTNEFEKNTTDILKQKKVLKRSITIREVDAGSDNSQESEIAALMNPVYDSERFGISFVASPKHADLLMVTGPVTRNMKDALIKAYMNVPDPKIVIAVGDEAKDGGIFKDSYAVVGGVDEVIPVDYYIKGSPANPTDILNAIFDAVKK